MPTPGKNTFLADADDLKLSEWVRVHTCGTIYRHRYEDDPVAYAREHQAEGCCVWHAGKTIVGAAGFDPEARLRESR